MLALTVRRVWASKLVSSGFFPKLEAESDAQRQPGGFAPTLRRGVGARCWRPRNGRAGPERAVCASNARGCERTNDARSRPLDHERGFRD